MSTTAIYGVSGMSCGHCIAAVTEEVGRLDGVSDVGVELVTGGVSRVTVVSVEVLRAEAVRDAVAEAGYRVIG